MDESTFLTVRSVTLAGILALGLLLERVARHASRRPEWSTNLWLWVVDAAVIGIVCGACACSVARWATASGLGLLNVVRPPLWLAALVTVLGLDALSYAWHRANHRWPFLWRFHQVHHGDRTFNVSTALRFHPGELLLSLPVRLAAVVALGAPVAAVLVFELVFTAANILEHGNFDLSRRLERALETIFVTPALHRRHHSSQGTDLDSNFATVLTLWDRIGGTFAASSSAVRISPGIPGEVRQTPVSILEALLWPLRPRLT